ncbi:hypothetical protein Golax_019328 [Gossypium laxum]|uniref:Uncharacterized protein n=1 Tax=Gossypium laxum TaxID=34288 RepID=A0A7J8Z6A5_9ROSI|nr:hypothetical protein [Gossypium laxum]
MAGVVGVEASTSSESEKLQKLTQIVLPKFVALLVTEMENKMMVQKEGLKSCHEARSMARGCTFDLAYFIALACRHQIERSRKGPIYLGPYVTRLE